MKLEEPDVGLQNYEKFSGDNVRIQRLVHCPMLLFTLGYL